MYERSRTFVSTRSPRKMFQNRVMFTTVFLFVLLVMETSCLYRMEPTLRRGRRGPFYDSDSEYGYNSDEIDYEVHHDLSFESDEIDYEVHHGSSFERNDEHIETTTSVNSPSLSTEDVSSTAIPTISTVTTTPPPPSPTTTITTTTPEPVLSQLHYLLLEEARRHPWRGMDRAPPALRKALQAYKNSGFEKFCAEAHHQDKSPYRVEDGGFHPKYEIVPGVGLYRFHATPLTWDAAREVCEKEGAQLAVVNYLEEARVLVEMHNRCPFIIPSHFNDYQHLGARDIYSEGTWETIAGYPLNDTGYVRWGYGQPDDAHHFGEDCLAMNRYGFFNDVPCWVKLPFTCEHP